MSSGNRTKKASLKLVVVANRLPVRKVGGTINPQWKSSPGGLVTALKPILKEVGGVWVGWPGDTGEAPKPFTHEGIKNKPVGISEEEHENFYYGFSNRTLWPLYHDAVRTPEYHRHWWWPYVEVNKRFAKAAVNQTKDGDLVWVHDYQLQLVPQMIREQRPGAKIGFFLHIPFPPEELFSQLPWRRSIIEGLLGADLLGFQTKGGAQNFIRAAKKLTSAKAGAGEYELKYQGRTVRAQAYPISIDNDFFGSLAADPEVIQKANELRSIMGDRKVILGVDRLDYTKGIDIRLKSFEELLNRGEASVNNVIMVQIAVPSRADVEEYAAEREQIERIVGRINGRFGEAGLVAVHYLYRSLPIKELVAFYLAADVLMVTPLRDGMNLVAKEYVACRLDGTGVLVLSEFAGAAHELRGALTVNPHDVDGMAQALEASLHIGEAEARKRMTALRRVVTRNDVYAWADHFLDRLRS